jgi:hypothetical protein
MACSPVRRPRTCVTPSDITRRCCIRKVCICHDTLMAHRVGGGFAFTDLLNIDVHSAEVDGQKDLKAHRSGQGHM